jgi:GNAT superfamily N-acetyltransferase
MTNLNVTLVGLDADAWEHYADEIMDIQVRSYEPSRRDTAEFLYGIVCAEGAICLLALISGQVAGYGFGAPLEYFGHVRGIRDDENFGAGNTLYGADVTVAAEHRGAGLGRAMKRAQLEGARDAGYGFVTGRNRVGVANVMWRLNRALGASEVTRITDDYTDGPEPRDAIYYRIALGRSSPDFAASVTTER